MADRRNMSVEDLIRSQLKSEEKFTDQRSSHFKLCIAVNYKSLQKQICPKSFDMPFGTVIIKLKLVQEVERKMHYARQTFEINFYSPDIPSLQLLEGIKMPTCTHTGRFISVPLCSGNLNWLLFVFLSNLIVNLMYNIKKLYLNDQHKFRV